MAQYTTLPLYRDTYRLILLLFTITRTFAREYKYSIGQEIKHDTMQLVRYIYRANSDKANRVEHLKAFADGFEIVRLQVRLCLDLRIVSPTQFAQVAELMESVSKQTTGWRRSATTEQLTATNEHNNR